MIYKFVSAKLSSKQYLIDLGLYVEDDINNCQDEINTID